MHEENGTNLLGTQVSGKNYPLCDKAFTAAWSLRRHMQLHKGQYSYQCTECRKRFNEKSHYDAHMRGHEGIMFYCKYCDKSFTQKESHRKHMSVRSGEYKYGCNKCGKGFNVRKQYENHLKTHAPT